MESSLYTYSIMRLNVPDDQILTVCEDIKQQYLLGISSCPLFSMSLVPEGKTPLDKVDKTIVEYKKFKTILDEMKIPNGVLIQSSVGHGWVLGEKFTFQPYIGFEDGKEQEVVCPLDEDFKNYYYEMAKRIALTKPNAIMIDDDFRTLPRPGKGCCCPLHLKKVNEALGENLTREELLEITKQGDEKAKKYHKAFVDVQHKALVELAKVVRKAVDDVDPEIPIPACGCGGYNAKQRIEVAKIFAGKHPSIFRVGNGRYNFAGKRHFVYGSQRAALLVQKMGKDIDILIAETDTCPHNRYGTDASELHTQYTTSILEGLKGAKHWITPGPYEPDSGLGYRKILAKYAKFYEQLCKDVEGIKWQGFNSYVSHQKDIPGAIETGGWASWVFESLGLPLYFSNECTGVVCVETFDGQNAHFYTDEEIINILSSDCILDQTTAKIFEERGFGKYLGVSVTDRDSTPLKGEIAVGETVMMKLQPNIKKLVITNENAVIDSYAFNSLDGNITKDLIFPSVVSFKNELGGNVTVFAGAPSVNRTYFAGFGYLTETRKKQFIRLIKKADKIPAYYTGDIETFVKAGYTKNGELLISLVDMSADEIENPTLYIKDNVTEIKMLAPNGEKVNVPFTKNGDIYTLDLTVYCLKPTILYIK